VWVQANPGIGARIAVPFCLGSLFVVFMFCHDQLATLKPESTGLTSFYLCISFGGALGGVFVGLLGPSLFSGFFELQVATALCLVLGLRLLFRYRSKTFLVTCGVLTAILLRSMSGLSDNGTTIYRARNFYGALAVREDLTRDLGKVRMLV